MLHQNQTTEPLRFIRCSIRDEAYGLDLSWVRSIQRIDRLHHSPENLSPQASHRHDRMKAPGHEPMGWLPGNERDIPVFSLARRLGRSPLPPLSTENEHGISQRIVVLNPLQSAPQMGREEATRPWALLVDRVSQVVKVQADRIVPFPPIPVSPSAEYFGSVVKLDEGLILLLSPERLHPQALASASIPEAEVESPDTVPSTRRTEANVEGPFRSQGQIVVFQVTRPNPTARAISFGLSISQVPEILEAPPVTPIPATPAFVSGLVNWRGLPVPVIDLAGRMGLGQVPDDKRTRLIIARGTVASGKGAWVGLTSRSAIRLLRLPIVYHPCCRSLPFDPALTRGVFELENETLVIPNIQGILQQDRARGDEWACSAW